VASGHIPPAKQATGNLVSNPALRSASILTSNCGFSERGEIFGADRKPTPIRSHAAHQAQASSAGLIQPNYVGDAREIR
jgi:hypothetical protein